MPSACSCLYCRAGYHGPCRPALGQEAFWRQHAQITCKPVVNAKVGCYIQGAAESATDESRAFHHQVDLFSTKIFKLQPTIIDSGPYKGAKALILLPTKTFRFQRLPPELRELVYEWILSNELKSNKKCSILRTSKEIYYEARRFLFKGRHFRFNSTWELNYFLRQIRSNIQFLTNITVSKSGTNALMECYKQLVAATKLQSFTVCLPKNFKGTIGEHIDKHWEALRSYLLANSVDESESKLRLQKISFTVGGSRQNSVTTDQGARLRSVTPEINLHCRRQIEAHIEHHFRKQRFEAALARQRPRVATFSSISL